uniref:tRNA ligase kinase domain-containing protein n=1 Tax=Aureoumbra lagunensis TaxID=44058 RepID=A0A7S3JWI1_9STRA
MSTALFNKADGCDGRSEGLSSEISLPTGHKQSVIVVPVGLPGSGKSTYFFNILTKLPFVHRYCQDVLGNIKTVKDHVIECVRAPGNLIYVDRTNINRAQRKHWIDIAHSNSALVVALIFSTDISTCITRASNRSQHEGGLDSRNPQKCSQVIRTIERVCNAVSADEGFDKIFTLPLETEEHKKIASQLHRLRSKPDTTSPHNKQVDQTNADVNGDLDEPAPKKIKLNKSSNDNKALAPGE